MKKLLFALVLVLAACAGGESGSEAEPDASEQTTAADQEAPSDTQAPEPSEAPAPAGGEIAITLTIGDETWEFGFAQCAFYDAPAGESGSEWNVSSTAIEGLQVYVNDDSTSASVEITDIANGGNPTLSWEAFNDAVTISADGNQIAAEGTFTDNVNGGTSEGTLTATCPSWFDAS